MRALIVDAYDSFVHILKQYLAELGVDSDVQRVDDVSLAAIDGDPPDFLLLGPGPGHPADSGHVEIANHCLGRIPMLGICLGHQALAIVYGGQIGRLPRVRHGKPSRLVHDGAGMFQAVPSAAMVMRYHSLIVLGPTVRDAAVEFTAFAADDGALMGLRHRRHRVESVQFHPESVGTDHGHAMLEGFIATHVRAPAPQPLGVRPV